MCLCLSSATSYKTAIRQNIDDGVNKRRAENYKPSKRKTIVHKVNFILHPTACCVTSFMQHIYFYQTTWPTFETAKGVKDLTHAYFYGPLLSPSHLLSSLPSSGRLRAQDLYVWVPGRRAALRQGVAAQPHRCGQGGDGSRGEGREERRMIEEGSVCPSVWLSSVVMC